LPDGTAHTTQLFTTSTSSVSRLDLQHEVVGAVCGGGGGVPDERTRAAVVRAELAAAASRSELPGRCAPRSKAPPPTRAEFWPTEPHRVELPACPKLLSQGKSWLPSPNFLEGEPLVRKSLWVSRPDLPGSARDISKSLPCQAMAPAVFTHSMTASCSGGWVGDDDRHGGNSGSAQAQPVAACSDYGDGDGHRVSRNSGSALIGSAQEAPFSKEACAQIAEFPRGSLPGPQTVFSSKADNLVLRTGENGSHLLSQKVQFPLRNVIPRLEFPFGLGERLPRPPYPRRS
jgi:hypothetical protein